MHNLLCFVSCPTLTCGARLQCGRGGMLKMWDPDLRDTTEPLMCVDLKAFAVEGDPQLNARTTSEQFLRLHLFLLRHLV
jgi:hypothetical protein